MSELPRSARSASPVGVPWDAIEALLDRALDLAPAAQEALIETTRSSDPSLAAEVARLLAAGRRAGAFLEQPAAVYAASLLAWTAEQPLDPGTKLGPYRIVRRLGRGATATVYLATDAKHRREVAVKVLHPALAETLGTERFLREIEIAAALHHPHILPLFDSGRAPAPRGSDELLFYVMPHVDGESLRARLQRQPPLRPAEALRIAREVAGALDHSHRHGLVHRDIKPENILLQDGQAIVADFGIARALDAAGAERSTEAGLGTGTPAYMSPEQVAAGAVDGRTDVYALGCVLYEMLAGQPPFRGSAEEIRRRHCEEAAPALPPATVGPAVGRAVTRALAKRPEDRFATAGALAEALSHDAAPSRRRRVVAGAASAVAAAILILATRRSADLTADHVLVAAFENLTGNPRLEGFAALVGGDIARGLAATVNVGQVTDQRSLSPARGAPHLDLPAVGAAARKARAGYAVWGSYEHATGDSVSIRADIVDARTGRIARVVGPMNIASTGDSAVAPFRARVMAAFASMLDPDLQGASAPSTYPAYQEWREAIAAVNGCAGDWTDCREQQLGHLRRSAAIDSGFTLPQTSASLVYSHAGDCRAVDSIVVVLGPRLVQLPVVDRAELQASAMVCRGDRLAALAQARSALRQVPSNRPLGVLVATLALESNQPHLAIRTLEAFRPSGAVDLYEYFTDLLGAYHRAGWYERALSRAVRDRGSGTYDEQVNVQALLVMQEIASLAALGRPSELTTVLNDAVTQFDAKRRRSAVIWAMELAGLELAAHGFPGAARPVQDGAIAWVRRQPPEQQATSEMRMQLASLLNDEGRWNEAYPIYRSLAMEDSSAFEPRLMLGDIAARRGDRRAAERAMEWLAAHVNAGSGSVNDWTLYFLRLGQAPNPAERDAAKRVRAWRTMQVLTPQRAMAESWSLYLRAQVAGLLGDRERAIGLLQEATRKGFSRWSSAHVDPDMAGLREDADFMEWMRPKD